MKTIFATFIVLLLLTTAATANAQSIDKLAAKLSKAFEAKTFAALDADKATSGSVQVTLEHSLGGRSTVKSFKNLTAVERWLKGREHDGGPARNGPAVKRCNKGTCTYDINGLLHNNLYLKRITYGYRGKRPLITTIRIRDGD